MPRQTLNWQNSVAEATFDKTFGKRYKRRPERIASWQWQCIFFLFEKPAKKLRGNQHSLKYVIKKDTLFQIF